MTRARIFALALLAVAPIAAGAAAEGSYPVSGRWTAENASEKGPAKECRGRIMEFRGAQRLDSGGGVPQYRNVSVTRASSSLYAVVDEFFTVQIRGRVAYTLSIRDPDHIEIKLDRGGTIALRRCE
jgi:hypothetical protein